MNRDSHLRPATDPRKPGFIRSDDGGILVFWALFLAIAFGFAALTFDLGRVANTQTELQSFADQVALAAAGELDGRPGARLRAQTAAEDLISRDQTFGQGRRSLSGDGTFTLTLLSGRNGPVATSDAAASFARVEVNRTTVATPFAAVNAALIGRRGESVSSDVGAVAVAGRTTFACDITPLFFCIPDAGWRAEANIGIQVRVVPGSAGNSAWGPGNFGFLDPTVLDVDPTGPCAGLNGAQLYRCLIGAERGITQCIETTATLETRPGQAVGLTNAFNTRFDIFQGPMSGFRTNPRYRPAPNVLEPGAPGRPASLSTTQIENLVRDSCIQAGTCAFGAGDWNRDGYLSAFHNGQWPIANDPRPAAEVPLRENATRYDVYLAEIASARERGDTGMPTAAGVGTNFGRPRNHSSAQNAGDRALLDPSRRLVVAAGVDCGGQSMNGRTEVFALEYIRLFLTEPVQGTGSDARILAEVVGSAGGLGSGAGTARFHEVIQLVR